MHSPFRSSLSPETRRPQLQPPPPFATTTTARNNHHPGVLRVGILLLFDSKN
ncbi:hypothetical protein HanXRQr2_Chr02g0054731 [Helianthus annuus]|uniref:Uncharacterized protein n=1 Tax=Helianthus annuus TaxID=4232 RepID=A0A9K3P082_HELAN|nr:hypothetical protein HanXRQr2_Chr02g0054731 [Helianthus annuus]